MSHRTHLAALALVGATLLASEARAADDPAPSPAPAQATAIAYASPAAASPASPRGEEKQRPYAVVGTTLLVIGGAAFAGGTFAFIKSKQHESESDKLSAAGYHTASIDEIHRSATWAWVALGSFGTGLAAFITGGALLSVTRTPKRTGVALVPSLGGAGLVGSF